jgi:drug/metabolite transporter (DMT)-like permease
VNGYLAAAIAVLIWAAYPVATRAAVTGSFGAMDLVALRFGLGALLFLPYLLIHFHAIGRRVWLKSLPLTLFQGAGMGALVICGLQFAPASHQAALGPGASPAWVAILGFIVFAKKPSAGMVFGAVLCAAGVLVLTYTSTSRGDPTLLLGDAMFLAASALGALYVLQLRNSGGGAMQSAAIVSVYSAMVVVPWYLCCTPSPFSHVPSSELLWQALWQGVLIGCVSLVALNHAIQRLGAERSCAMVALVPVVSAILAVVFLGEHPSPVEIVAILAICAGVSIGAAPAATPAGPLPAARR